MTGRATVSVIPSSVVKMWRFIVFSCCVVLSVCQINNCGENEEMKCVQPCPPQKTCRNRDIQFSCLQSVQPCQHICVCKTGYLRNDVGTCVTNEECDNKNVKGGSSELPEDGSQVRRDADLVGSTCTGENEVHTDCKKSCPPNTCLSLVARFKCDSTEPCRKGCVCKPGYLRQQPDSPCIPTCQCTQMKHSPDCRLHDSTTKE